MHKKYIKQFIAAAGVAILVVAIFIASKFEKVCNKMVDLFYRPYAKIVSSFTSKIPFSIFELLAVLAAIILLFFLILIFENIKKDRTKSLNALSSLILFVLVVVFYYSFFTSFMYNRSSFNIEKENTLISDDVAKEYCMKYLIKLNELANLNETNENSLTVYKGEKDVATLIEEEFENLTDPYYVQSSTRAKKMNFSFLMTLFSISGITFIPTIEPCYNNNAPLISQTMTIAHEIAHTKAVMREYEADMLAYYVLMNSDNTYLQYVGYLNALSYITDVFVLTNNYEEYKNFPFASNIFADLEYVYSWWSENNKLEKVGDFFNNIYLKSNNQDGVKSYRSYASYETYFDEELNKKIYVVKKYSDTQNMLFSIIKQI